LLAISLANGITIPGNVIGPCYVRASATTGDKECACCDIKPEDCARKFQIYDAANCACRDPIGPLKCEERTTPDWCAAGPCGMLFRQSNRRCSDNYLMQSDNYLMQFAPIGHLFISVLA
jgi:hypothetical protein